MGGVALYYLLFRGSGLLSKNNSFYSKTPANIQFEYLFRNYNTGKPIKIYFKISDENIQP